MNIFLIRHGQTTWNDEGRIQGNVDTELDLIGIKQAELTGRRLANHSIEQIISSDLHRAVQTGQIINNYVNTKFIIDPVLREINYGEWEGKRMEEIEAKYPSYVQKWRQDRINIPAPGGESFSDLAKRLQSILIGVKNQAWQSIAIISHAGVLKTLTCMFLGLGLENHLKFSFKNCSISSLHYNTENNQAQIICLNDFSHLEEKI